MKRIVIFLSLPIFLITLCLSASAESGSLSLKYVPRTERGTLFYLDVYSDTPVGAAVFELSYDPSAAEFRSVIYDDDRGAVTANPDGGRVKIAFSHRSGVSGKLYRIAFKALAEGVLRFELRTTQAVDAKAAYLTGISGAALDVDLSKEDIVSADSSKKSASEKSSSKKNDSKKSYGGSKSEISMPDDAVLDEKPDDYGGVYRDLSKPDHTSWFLLGGSAVILAGLFVGLGILLGIRAKKKQAPPMDEDEPQIQEEPEELPAPQPTVEEIFKEIE